MVAWLVVFPLFLLCSGISLTFLVYISIIWYTSYGSRPASSDAPPAHKTTKKGLSPTELEMLPGALEDGRAVAEGLECAVCLEVVEEGQTARVMPECGHVFHRACADAWLSRNAACPTCRTPLPPPVMVALSVLHQRSPEEADAV